MLFLDRLQQHSVTRPDAVAVEFVDDTFAPSAPVTYAGLERTVQRSMALLAAKGVRPGDRVALQLPKCLPFVYLYLAAMRLGAICLPLNTGYPARELAYFLADAEACLLVADERARAVVEELRPEQPWLREVVYLPCGGGTARLDAAFAALLASPPSSFLSSAQPSAALPLQPSAAPDSPPFSSPYGPATTCLMIYTSGTTGRPKGAELTHGNLTAGLDALVSAWGWQPDDVLLHVLPIFHVHGLLVALQAALQAGAATIMYARFDPAHTLAALSSGRPTVFMAVPTIHRRLVDTALAQAGLAPNAPAFDLSHLRLVTSGSDRLPDDLFAQFQALFGHTLLERYGMSETIMLISNPLHGERRVGSVGLPLPGVEVRIVDPETEAPLPDETVGEVQVRGANVFVGYWRQPEKTAAAFTPEGWFRTGDLGQRSADGYFTLKGRSKDLIISGGYNVYPPEVELVLAEHPAVAASAVIGCPDPEWGERVTAIVVLNPSSIPSSPPSSPPTSPPSSAQPSAAHSPHPPGAPDPIAQDSIAQDIIAFCRARLAAYKAPRQIIFVPDLPRNAMGKTQKASLRQELCT